ncbi:MAG: hypothetical protein Salg2KO_20160 [Salibacteraceae bacterium]
MLVSAISAQDLHFSQFNHASVLLSPTETGNYHGDWRIINNHRNQWANIGKPLTTTALAFDRQVYIHNQKLSIGGQYVYDESGNYRMVHQKFLLAVAYHQTIGYQTFRLGIQGGLVQKRLNSGGLSWPDQWDQGTGEFNNQRSTRELFINQIIYYPDINIGAAYSTRVWKLKPEFTFALFHINRPSESFLYRINRLKMRKVFYVRTPFDLKGKWSLDPQFLVMWQSKSVDFVVGSYANYGLAKNPFRAKQAFAGLSLRNSITRNWDAFIVTGGLQFKRLRAAISYDITVSDLRLANSYSGAVEFAIIYTGISSVLNQRAIPCKRI